MTKWGPVETVGRFSVKDTRDSIQVSVTENDDFEPEYFEMFKGTGDDIEMYSEIAAGNGPAYLEALWAIHTEGIHEEEALGMDGLPGEDEIIPTSLHKDNNTK